jgi:hypothetical protein
MLPERYKRFSRPTVQAVKEQTELLINGCRIYGRNCVKSRRVRGHIAAFREVVRDRLCGLVVRVSGYRYRGLGFDPRRYQIF